MMMIDHEGVEIPYWKMMMMRTVRITLVCEEVESLMMKKRFHFVEE